MVRILSGIFPIFPPQNPPIFPHFSLFLTPFSSTFFLSFFTLVVFRGAKFVNRHPHFLMRLPWGNGLNESRDDFIGTDVLNGRG